MRAVAYWTGVAVWTLWLLTIAVVLIGTALARIRERMERRPEVEPDDGWTEERADRIWRGVEAELKARADRDCDPYEGCTDEPSQYARMAGLVDADRELRAAAEREGRRA